MADARPRLALWVLLGLGILATGFITWALWPSDPGPAGITRTSEGEVTVTATLLDDHDGPVRFLLVLDTHNVDLTGFDPVEQVRLETSSGVLSPMAVSQTTDNTGHHVEMELEFATDHGDDVVLVVTGLGDEHRLVFA